MKLSQREGLGVNGGPREMREGDGRGCGRSVYCMLANGALAIIPVVHFLRLRASETAPVPRQTPPSRPRWCEIRPAFALNGS